MSCPRLLSITKLEYAKFNVDLVLIIKCMFGSVFPISNTSTYREKLEARKQKFWVAAQPNTH